VLSNIVYDEATDQKTVKWGINLPGIIKNIENIIDFGVEGQY